MVFKTGENASYWFNMADGTQRRLFSADPAAHPAGSSGDYCFSTMVKEAGTMELEERETHIWGAQIASMSMNFHIDVVDPSPPEQ
jgi:hypothetical protein